MNEQVFLGGCPVIRPEGIYINGHRVITLGLSMGLGDVGDLLAYRQEWEPFIAAHLALWREVNSYLENNSAASQCPAGIFKDAQIQSLPPSIRSFCASLSLSRMYTSETDPNGILPQWNAWRNKSAAEILAGATPMVEWHQEVVMKVGGPYKDSLMQIAKTWNIGIQLPDLPTFSTQQEIIARIEGAYIATKGVVQIVGYGVGETLKLVGSTAQAVAEGLSDTAKQLPKAISPWTWIGVAAAVALVGGALIVYYVPRRAPQQFDAGVYR